MTIPTGGALVWLLGAALAGGLARGFSGFGAALIFVPLAAVALGPQHAAPLMLVLEVVAIVSLTPAAWRQADRREVGWLGRRSRARHAARGARPGAGRPPGAALGGFRG